MAFSRASLAFNVPLISGGIYFKNIYLFTIKEDCFILSLVPKLHYPMNLYNLNDFQQHFLVSRIPQFMYKSGIFVIKYFLTYRLYK